MLWKVVVKFLFLCWVVYVLSRQRTKASQRAKGVDLREAQVDVPRSVYACLGVVAGPSRGH
jgi:hypothetical protein